VPFYGVYDWLNRYQSTHDQILPWIERNVVKQSVGDARDVFDRASPIARVHAGAPPFFILHGANDSLVSADQARRFADELRTVSHNPVVHAELPLAQHAFDLVASPRTVATVQAVERFLEVVYAERKHGLTSAATTT